MRIEKLSIQNFLGYKDRVDLDFTSKNVIVIAGKNESGKSSILQAISYLLYGKTRASKDVDLINTGASSDLLVSGLVALPSGKGLNITRGRTLKNESILLVEGFPSTRKPDIQKHIQDQLCLSYEDFIGLSYFKQGDIHQFMQGNKREYFQRWTNGLKIWAKMEDEIKTRSRQITIKVDRLQIKKQAATSILNREPDILQDLINAEKETTACEKREHEALDLLTKLKFDMSAIAENDKILKQIRSIHDDLRHLEIDIKRSGKAKLRIDDTISKVSSGLCPLLSIKCDPFQATQQIELGKAETELSETNRSLKNQRKLYKKTKHKIEDLKKSLIDTSAENLRDQIKQAEFEVNLFSKESRLASRCLAKAQIERDSLDEANQILAEIKTDLSKFELKQRRLSFVQHMCSKSGIPSILIRQELKVVQDRCNWVFERLDYPKRIRFESFKTLSSWEKTCSECGFSEWSKGVCKDCGCSRQKAKRDEPTVTILDGSSERPFELESGGAQVLQSFAVRLACSLFRANLAGVPVQLVMLDEVFAMLDRENRQKLMSLVVDKLSTEFGLSQQFVVTHHDDVISSVKHVLEVKKVNGSSVATWRV